MYTCIIIPVYLYHNKVEEEMSVAAVLNVYLHHKELLILKN